MIETRQEDDGYSEGWAKVQDVLTGRKPWAVVVGDNRAHLAFWRAMAMQDGVNVRFVDHAISDPPFSGHTHANQVRGSGAGVKGSLSFDPLTEAHRLFLLEWAALHVDRWQLYFTDDWGLHHWMAGAEAVGLEYIRTGAWVKDNPMAQKTGDRPGSGFEPAAILHRPGRKQWNGGGKPALWRYPLEIGPDRPPHETPKSKRMMCEIIRDYTDPGDVVLDPFSGSGTTGEACVMLGRLYIGIEYDPWSAHVSMERLEAATLGLTWNAHRRGQMPLFDAQKTVRPERKP